VLVVGIGVSFGEPVVGFCLVFSLFLISSSSLVDDEDCNLHAEMTLSFVVLVVDVNEPSC
jgi:hypothetical protein